MTDLDVTDFKNLILEASKIANPGQDKADLLFANVISTSPLTIRLEKGLDILSKFLILSPFCRDKSITIPSHTHPIEALSVGGVDIPAQNTGDNPGLKIVIWRGLNVGDRVVVIRADGGQKYYILHKEVG